MKESDFVLWAKDVGVDSESLSILLVVAPCESIVTLFSYNGMKQMNEDKDYPIEAAAVKSGLFIIGSSGSGDPIAIDFKNNAGSIHFVNHEEMDGQNVLTVKIADNMRDFVSLLEEEKLPIDYFDALD